MRIAVLSLGSRDDVQPLIALGAALGKRGHDVRLITHANFAALAAGRGITFEGVAGDFQTVLSCEDGQRLTASGRNPLAALGAMRAIARHGREWWTQLRDLSAGADVLVSGTTTFGIAASLAELWGIPWIHTCLQPLSPTRAFPSPMLPPPALHLPGWANRLHHHLGTQLIWQTFRRSFDDCRREISGPGTMAVRRTHRALSQRASPRADGIQRACDLAPARLGRTAGGDRLLVLRAPAGLDAAG
jgi:sterol 3beta-glucosyltransferase